MALLEPICTLPNLVSGFECCVNPISLLLVLDHIVFDLPHDLSLQKTGPLHFLDLSGDTPEVPLQPLPFHGQGTFIRGLIVNHVPVPVLKGARVWLVHERDLLPAFSLMTVKFH
jgi:hypothetical protein